MLAAASALAAPLPDQTLREAARLDSQGQCEQAEAYYQRIIEAGQLGIAALNNLGNHYVVCGNPRNARQWYTRLLELNPHHENANLQMARLEVADRNGREALAYLSRLPVASPAVRLLRAEAMFLTGERSTGAELLSQIGKDAAGEPGIFVALGATCERVGLFDCAENAFSAVLANHPDEIDLLFRLGRSASRAQHYDRAQHALEGVLNRRPNDADALLELGRLFAVRQDPSRAVYFLAKARQNSPKRADVLLALARAAEDAGFYGDSTLAYDEYLAVRPEDEAARRDRALVYGLSGKNPGEAISQLERYTRDHQPDPLGHFALARLIWNSHPERALEELTRALAINPRQASTRFARAWLLYRNGKVAQALADLEATRAAEPDNVRVLAQLGLVLLTLERPAEAEKVLTRAVAISPEDPDVLLHLGRSLMALDRPDDAQRYLTKYQKLRPQMVRGPRTEAGMIELATLGRAELAQREIERLRFQARAHPGDAALQQHLASLLVTGGKLDEGVQEFKSLLTRDIDASIAQEAGVFLLGVRQYSLAKQFLARAAEAKSSARLDLALATFFAEGPGPALQALEGMSSEQQSGDYLLLKAKLLDANGQSAESARVLAEGLEAKMSHPQIAVQAALLLARQGRKEEALALLRRAASSMGADPELLTLTAEILGGLRQYTEAEKTIGEVELRWPEWDRAWLVHAVLLENQGRPAEARRKAETAIALGSTDPSARAILARLKVAPSAEP